ncbi:hypothetical protein HPG69_010875 [Diceros bicornis minor]|uniref:Uncharacterized protein n=1 Tax=Diceros bicornis minor TaxID=77932 RepID=A0A7J7EGB2_DICBM|nr:hypothetical protein HPG69_010875 [Diceros bicornis minor]
MTCPCKANGGSSRCWHFDVCDSENRNCTLVDAGERQLKETLDNDNDITMFLMKVSNGDCKKWLEEFLLHWERMLETTGPVTAAATRRGVENVCIVQLSGAAGAEEEPQRRRSGVWTRALTLPFPFQHHQPRARLQPNPGPRPPLPSPGSSW